MAEDMTVLTASEREPLVNILLMTYNRAHYLPVAIETWLGQTYRNFELIISDDASRARYKLLRLHRHKS